MSTLYSSRASARKGAKRAGLMAFDIVADGEKFKFVSAAEAAVQEPKAKSAKPKAPTKVSRVQALCEREGGATLEQIVAELDVSKAAASSLISDLRRRKIDVIFKDGVYKI
jgi:hypothetical protein